MKLNLGENLRKCRKEANMTQEQLAEQLGVTYQSVSRWEVGATYPDMEMIPVIAKLFGTTTDALFGIPDEKKEEAALEAFQKLSAASAEHPIQTEKIVELIRDIRRNYLTSAHFWHFWISVNRSVYRNPEILPEVRLTVEAYLKCDVPQFEKEDAIQYMVELEDEEHLTDFLSRHAASQDNTMANLLWHRYAAMGQWEKLEPIRQERAFNLLTEPFERELLWFNPAEPPDLLKHLACYRLQADYLHHLTGKVPSAEHPISCDGEVNGWTDTALYIGFRLASCLASTGETEEALNILEDVVSLLEKGMAITTTVKVSFSSPWFDLTDWVAEETWTSASRSNLMTEEYEERAIQMHNEKWWCSMLYPSWYYGYLTTRQNNWAWFDPIREHPRYLSYVDRVKSLVKMRKKQA